MFRFYKLYSLYMNNMASGPAGQREWCLCEKLPRAVLHIPVNHRQICQVCGLARRPQAGPDSSSDKDIDQGTEEQKTIIPEQSQVEEPKKSLKTRVKVAIRGKKPKAKNCCRTNCHKCGGLAKAEVGQEGTEAPKEMKCKRYPGRHGLYSKPKGMMSRRQVAKAPPPSTPSSSLTLSPLPSSPPSPTAPPPPPLPHQEPESARSEMPSLVAMAHTVSNPKNNLLQNYNNLFVSNFIPLQSPITDTFGGAISKRSNNSIRPRIHRSRPLPPLSKVLTNILSSQNSKDDREMGGGLSSCNCKDSKSTDSDLASQFCPFDQYEGPSEDALVVNSARYMLHRPKSLHIEPRQDVHNNRIESLNFQYSSTKNTPSPNADNLSGILFMTHSVRKNLKKTIDNIGNECHISGKTRPTNSSDPKPAVTQQSNREIKAKESEDLERSSILTSIMDKVFSSQESKSSNGNCVDDKIPELEDINKTISDMFVQDPECVSLKSNVSNEHSVFSSNKTSHCEDYSQPVSKTLSISNSTWERICDTKSKSTLYKCARCGQHKHREDIFAKIKIKDSKVPGKSDANQIRLNKKIGCAIKQRLNSLRSFSGAQECKKLEHERKTSLKPADQEVIPEIFRENRSMQKRKATDDISKEENIRRQSISTSIQRKEDSLASQTPIKDNSTSNCVNLQAKIDKILRRDNNPAKINDQPKITLSKIRHECLQKRPRIALKDVNLNQSQIPDNNFQLRRHKEPSFNWGVMQICETVSHRSLVIPKILVPTYVGESVHIGQATKCYIKENILPDYPSSSLFEFRIPDISPNELLSYRSSDDISGSCTPIPHTASPKEQPINHKNPCLPVDPTQSEKSESRKTIYENLELSFTTQKADSFNHPNNKLTYYENQLTSDNNMSQTSNADLQSLRKEENPLNASNPKTDITAVGNTFARSKENKENSKDTLYQENRITLQKYSHSKLSNAIRKQIDKSLQQKIKKIMSKPIKLLKSNDSDSVDKFVEPFTNKLGVFEEYNANFAQENLKLGPNAILNKETDTAFSNSFTELSSSQKPLRLITNRCSSSEPKCLTKESKVETDSDGASEPMMTCRTTDYEGLPPLNWQVISMGSAHPNNIVQDDSETSLGEEYYCPIHMCGSLIKTNTFSSHILQDHRVGKTKGASPQEDYQQVVEGLPKQFSFDGDLLTKGNTFVALLFYTSLAKERLHRMRNHPLTMLAAPKMAKDDTLAGVFFWLVGCPSCAQLLAKLTVYDPFDQIGRSMIIRPRDLSQNQDPREFVANSKDHLLISVPHKQRTFQITVVIDEPQT
ncbi:uncharacterized protein LOC6731722 isoform X2 [Drosophila simulans]|uniref:uncharacterized protein LOC6731722 isoform X2 n=1 Tax=Drosophila simulans TaxID=7240 RepID=UPI001D109BB0|nr:uncharacterized protein LOC6731722 isoform X2 [Drosophila simulans]